MKQGVYTREELQDRMTPVFQNHGIRRAWIFGSYARKEATEDSDVDLLVDTEDTKIVGLFALGGLYSDLEEVLQKPLDLVTLGALNQKPRMPSDAIFRETVLKERVRIYERS